MTFSRFAFSGSDEALLSVCGSFTKTKSGRIVFPSPVTFIIPRILPRIPVQRITAPEATLPSMLGKISSFRFQPIRVRRPSVV